MYNRELFNKVVNSCGRTECDPVTDEVIEEAQELLGVRFLFRHLQNERGFMSGGMV